MNNIIPIGLIPEDWLDLLIKWLKLLLDTDKSNQLKPHMEDSINTLLPMVTPVIHSPLLPMNLIILDNIMDSNLINNLYPKVDLYGNMIIMIMDSSQDLIDPDSTKNLDNSNPIMDINPIMDLLVQPKV
jgi:hypothetical protein